jgi:hypothetical protein
VFYFDRDETVRSGSFGSAKEVEGRGASPLNRVGFLAEAMDARLVAVETSLDTRYAHPRLTALASRAPGQDSTLGTDERQALLNEAAVCVERMRGRRDVDGNIILDAHASDVSIEYVAAGLALLCGRFRNKSGKRIPSRAAAACGKPTNRPDAIVAWVAKLERLEVALTHEEAQAAQQKRAREDEAERARAKVARSCAERAVHQVLQQARSAQHAAATYEFSQQSASDEARLEADAQQRGLFARALWVFSFNAVNVRRLCSGLLDALARWQLAAGVRG